MGSVFSVQCDDLIPSPSESQDDLIPRASEYKDIELKYSLSIYEIHKPINTIQCKALVYMVFKLPNEIQDIIGRYYIQLIEEELKQEIQECKREFYKELQKRTKDNLDKEVLEYEYLEYNRRLTSNRLRLTNR